MDANLKAQEGTDECLKIRNMMKIFDDGKVAVNNVNLNIYRGQVFILLGHNGAGKTTALSILSGLLSPTAGEAKIQGIDIFCELDKLRGMLGICPQESIFYEKMTVYEHMQIFSMLKGIQYDNEQESINQLMEQINLKDSANTIAETFSGGQKRKLSILMAFIGNPQILMLDEPTSGLDVSARQKIWQVIKEKKRNSIILMTTHYMDEAEQLGDRIAIMTDGEIKCCGSPLFLKNRFGTGYRLHAVKRIDSFNEAKFTELLSKHFPKIEKDNETRTEIIYKLPFTDVKQFSLFFRELDANLQEIGVSSYGVAITSLEDVFLKIGTDAEKGQKSIPIESSNKGEAFSLAEQYRHSCLRNILAVGLCNFKLTFRTARLLFSEIIMPFFIFVLAFITPQYITNYTYVYSPSEFPTPQNFLINTYSSYGEKTDSLYGLAKGYIPIPFDFKTSPEKDITETVRSFDEYVYNNSTGNGYIGSLYIHSFSSKEFQAMIMGNSTTPHSATLYANILTNKYLQTITHNQGLNVKLTVNPIPMFSEMKELVAEIVAFVMFIFYTGFALSSPPSGFAYSIVKDRKNKLKFLQLLNGLGINEYWIGRFVGDYAKLIIPVIIVSILEYFRQIHIPYYSLIIFVSLISVIPFGYLESFMFDDENKAYTVTQILNMLAGAPVGFIITMLKFLSMLKSDSSFNPFVIPDIILRIFPLYNMGATLSVSAMRQLFLMEGVPLEIAPLGMDFLGICFLATIFDIALLSFFIYLIETRKKANMISGIE